MTIQVGEVIAVMGVNIILRIFDNSNLDVIFHKGKKLKGISIREYVTIQRGFKDIVCIVQGEYLDESKYEVNADSKFSYIRKVEVKPIGFFDNDNFIQGIKYLPMIKDHVYLASEDQIKVIFGRDKIDEGFVIGELLKEEIAVSLPWKRIFNSHIGIFGNTGSGKSNTLTMLYTTLFQQKKEQIQGKSQFVVLDFNGEYTRDQLIEPQYKRVFNLSTKGNEIDKFPILQNEFWNAEILCLLFKATQNTQTPFIKRIVNGWQKYGQNSDSLTNYIKSTFERTFTSQSQKRESADLLITVSKVIGNESLEKILKSLSWQAKYSQFYTVNGVYFDGGDAGAYGKILEQEVNDITLPVLDAFQELILRINLQLVHDLLSGYVQFEHIQPLLKRIEALSTILVKVSEVDTNIAENRLLTVISLRQCNQEIKKIIPLLIAKHYYDHHKNTVFTPPDKTVHLIIDEAHNILSQQSLREEDSWKDHRIELFEEIIKEGRKFGFFLTLSSQRPADISPTIMSQVHNFFIHRLVNDRDLFLLDNTISTLDNLSKSMIPSLSKGSCIVTGTAFDLPLLIQVNLLIKDKQPDSEDVDLESLWSTNCE